MRKGLVLLLPLMLIFVLSACSKGYTNIDNEQLIEMLEQSDKYQFVDVRTHDEFSEQRIPGFTNYNLYFFENDRSKLDDLDKSIPVVIMCNSGNRSVTAAKIFIDEGFSEVYNLKDGIKGWTGETE